MRRRERVRPFRRPSRWLSTGMAGPGLFTLGWMAASLLVPGTHPWRQSISFLGQGRWGWVQNDNFVASGVLVLGFAGVLYGAGGPPALRRLARWQALAALGMVLAGLVRQQSLSGAALATPFGPLTAAGLGHIAGSALVYLAAVGACVGEGWPGGKRRAAPPWTTPAWQWWSRAIALGLVAGLGLFLVTAADGGLSGLWERVVALLASGWMTALVWRIQRAADRGAVRPG